MRRRIHHIFYIISIMFIMLIHVSPCIAESDIELLEFPSNFYKFTSNDLNSTEMQKIIQSVIPGATAVWYDKKDRAFMVIAGLIPLNRSQVETLSKSQFKNAMFDIGSEYQKVYSSKDQVKTLFDVYEDGSLLILKVTSNFVELGYPNTEWRYVYYYTPEYRMDIVINTRTSHLPRIEPEIQKSISQLQKRLVNRYPQGIKFRGNAGFNEEAHIENYYALNAFRIEAESGNIYKMGVVTKVHDLGTCQKIAREKDQPIGRWESVYAECIHGSDKIMDDTTYDQWFKSTFDNKPLLELYISFTDLNGYETRINFMGLPIAASAPMAASIVNSIKLQGIKNAKIIYPESKR